MDTSCPHAVSRVPLEDLPPLLPAQTGLADRMTAHQTPCEMTRQSISARAGAH